MFLKPGNIWRLGSPRLQFCRCRSTSNCENSELELATPVFEFSSATSLVFERTSPRATFISSNAEGAGGCEAAASLEPARGRLRGKAIKAHHSTSGGGMGKDQTRTRIRAPACTISDRAPTWCLWQLGSAELARLIFVAKRCLLPGRMLKPDRQRPGTRSSQSQLLGQVPCAVIEPCDWMQVGFGTISERSYPRRTRAR